MSGRSSVLVGVVGFEPTVSCSQSTCDNQASLHPAPDMIGRRDPGAGRHASREPQPASPRRAVRRRRRARAPRPGRRASPPPRAARRSLRRGPGCRRSSPPSSPRSSTAPGSGSGNRARSSRRGRPRHGRRGGRCRRGAGSSRRAGRRRGTGGPAGGAPTAGRAPAPCPGGGCRACSVGRHRSRPRTRVACPPEPQTGGRRCGSAPRGRRHRASAPRGRRGEGDPGGPQRAGAVARERGPDRVNARIGVIAARVDVVTPGGRSACQ